MRLLPVEFLPDDYKGPNGGTEKELIGNNVLHCISTHFVFQLTNFVFQLPKLTFWFYNFHKMVLGTVSKKNL